MLWDTWFRRGRVAPARPRCARKADEVIDFLEIGHVADELAGNLSGGQKKLLELGRTMMVDAKIVLLDEVGAGVNRTLLGTIADAIERLNRERGYTFCLIEHDMDFIARLCDDVIVMAEGRLLAHGEPGRGDEERGGDRGLSRPRPQEQAAPAPEAAAMSFLIGDAMTGGYGGADILHDCTIAVDKGEIAVIVGPNGAGKSTAMKAVFGMLKLRGGPGAARRRGHHRALAAAAGARRHGLRAAGRQRLHLDDRRGEPRDGRLHPRRRLLRHDGAGLRAVPDPASRSAASRRASSPAASASRSRSAAR